MIILYEAMALIANPKLVANSNNSVHMLHDLPGFTWEAPLPLNAVRDEFHWDAPAGVERIGSVYMQSKSL